MNIRLKSLNDKMTLVSSIESLYNYEIERMNIERNDIAIQKSQLSYLQTNNNSNNNNNNL